eukprot:7181655-Prymnesium_polylepis.1
MGRSAPWSALGSDSVSHLGVSASRVCRRVGTWKGMRRALRASKRGLSIQGRFAPARIPATRSEHVSRIHTSIRTVSRLFHAISRA